jgi:hypothetical protein
MLFETASATSDGSLMAAPRLRSSCSTGAISGVRAQPGWIDVVSTLGAL